MCSLEKIVELSVDVAAYGDGSADRLNVGLWTNKSARPDGQTLATANSPSIKISLTFSHSSFIALSGR